MVDVEAMARGIRASVDRPGPGPGLVEVAGDSAEIRLAIVQTLRDCGFWPLWIHALETGASLGRLAHRHVALLVCCGHERAAAAIVKTLARVSPRGHLVVRVDTSGERTGPTPPERGVGVCRDGPIGATNVAAGLCALPDVTGAQPADDRRCQRPPGLCDDDRRLLRLVEAGHTELAEAWLAALDVEARLCGRLLRDDTLRLSVWLRLWQQRHEEAARECGQILEPRPRQVLSRVVANARARPDLKVRPSITPYGAPDLQVRGTRHSHSPGDSPMYLLYAVPSLLQHLADADDELCGLRAAATWAIAHAGARAVVFVGADDGRVAAAVGGTGQTPSAEDRLMAVRADALECHDRGSLTLVVAPIRHLGARVGGVVVTGPADRRATVSEAATTLALLCASLLRTRLDQMSASRPGRGLVPEIVGDSPAAAAVRDAVARAASTPFAVLVEGESGTGKELVARALHRLSARRDRRFVAVNCAALSDELVEAELFGHTRGAFTGAVGARTGLFEDAHGGTLFLDEVAELSPRAQAKLLRVLQEREVRRVGENAARAIDVRVVAATNRPLVDACAAGQFRDDLRFCLAVVNIRLAPLRERAEDVASLARTFWARTVREVDKRAVLGADALARLASHAWPGNVRELQNVIAGLAVVAPARGRVAARHVDLVLATAGATRHGPPMSLERARRACDRQTVAAALARHAGSRTAAARELGLSRQGLMKIVRRLQMDEVVEGVA